jgi:hypothetical protein
MKNSRILIPLLKPMAGTAQTNAGRTSREFSKKIFSGPVISSQKNKRSQLIAALPDTLAEEANFLAEKIRDGVESLAMVHSRSTTGKILTISIGTATMVPNAENRPEDLRAMAENALLQAENSGGNRVISLNVGCEQANRK